MSVAAWRCKSTKSARHDPRPYRQDFCRSRAGRAGARQDRTRCNRAHRRKDSAGRYHTSSALPGRTCPRRIRMEERRRVRMQGDRHPPAPERHSPDYPRHVAPGSPAARRGVFQTQRPGVAARNIQCWVATLPPFFDRSCPPTPPRPGRYGSHATGRTVERHGYGGYLASPCQPHTHHPLASLTFYPVRGCANNPFVPRRVRRGRRGGV